jgi:hypothetical protein
MGVVLGLLSPNSASPVSAVCGDWDWDTTPTRRVDTTWSGDVDDLSTDAEVTAHVGQSYAPWNSVTPSPFAYIAGGSFNIGDTQDLTDVPDGQVWFTDASAPGNAAFHQWRTDNVEGGCGVNLEAGISYLDTTLDPGYFWWAEASGSPAAMQIRVKTGAVHEIGHNAGINHLPGLPCKTSNSSPLMAAGGVSGPEGCTALRTADRAALNSLYP